MIWCIEFSCVVHWLWVLHTENLSAVWKLEPVEFASPLSIQEFLPAFEFSSTKTTCRIRDPSWMPHTQSAHGCRCSLARLGDRSTKGNYFMGRDGPSCFSLMADQDHQGYWRGDPHQEGRWICVSWRFLWFWEGLCFFLKFSSSLSLTFHKILIQRVNLRISEDGGMPWVVGVCQELFL